jgi:hypothetical protein
VPIVFVAFDVNVAPAGRGAAVKEVIGDPFEVDAAAVNVMSTLDDPVTVAGAVTTGATGAGATVIAVVAAPESPLLVVATNVTLNVPDCVGVHVSRPVAEGPL